MKAKFINEEMEIITKNLSAKEEILKEEMSDDALKYIYKYIYIKQWIFDAMEVYAQQEISKLK